ncbi:MAG: hypothetical protein NPIRA02_42730 [Nitrospirales bacterium]|nr:MAG: hypothetical protein NPIRA02_42730 [Nitrospirales bacterium]
MAVLWKWAPVPRAATTGTSHQAVYPKPRTSQPGKGHRIYPYLLWERSITRPNQVWASDICYIPMAKGFMYLTVIMDWYSRRVLA